MKSDNDIILEKYLLLKPNDPMEYNKWEDFPRREISIERALQHLLSFMSQEMNENNIEDDEYNRAVMIDDLINRLIKYKEEEKLGL